MTSPTHYRTCNLCEAMCGLEIALDADRHIVSIKGDKQDPFSRGHICPKATALQDIYEDPDRLTHPLKRTAVGWEKIGWEEAFDEVAQRLHAVQEKHGRDAVAVYQGNPNSHNVTSILYSPTLVRALRTKNRYSATSVDQLPHHFASYHMFGHHLLLPVPDIDRTQFMLILGANPLASNGSIMTAPDVKKRLQAIQKRHGRVVVIDPRQTATAKLADQHFFIKPGRDVFLLLGLLHTLFTDNLIQHGRWTTFSRGLDELAQLTAEFTLEKVAPLTGIPAAHIRQLAHDFATAESAVCYGRIGTSVQAFGGLCNWLINLLNILTNNLDEPGGAMFTRPAFDVVNITGAMGSRGSHNRWQSRVRQRPEFAGELPVAVLAEEMLTPGEGQIRALITIAGNPVLSTPNGQQLDTALADLDFMVAIDIYLNETTRHADIILPPTTGLETAQFDIVFNSLAVRNVVKYAPPLFPPAPEADRRADWEIYTAVTQRLLTLRGQKHPPRRRDYVARYAPEQLLDLALRTGPYGVRGDQTHPAQNGQSLKLRTLRQNPHGLDLGPLQAELPHRLATIDQHIDLVPEVFVSDLARVRHWLAVPPTPQELVLIGRRDLRSNNSWMHNSLRLVKGKNRCTLLMHPDDAAVRGLAEGQLVTLQTRVGQLDAPLELSETMMPGVVSLPHGWGHGRDNVQLTVASQHPGVSLNDLTDDQWIDPLTGNAVLNGLPLTVSPAVAVAPIPAVHHETPPT